MSDLTIISKNRSDSNSLRSTIPHSIAKLLKLNDGDTIDWDFKIENNRPIAIVKPFRGGNDE